MDQLARVSHLILIALVAALGAIRPATASDTLTVNVDQATLIKIPDKVGTIVIGNPLIADVAVQAGGTLVVTGKGYGATNVVALDRQGNIVMEKAVRVEGPRDSTVVVYRGVVRETYSCQPRCERRITLGDGTDYFNATLAQTGVRNGQAQGAGQQAR
jgi:Flp pilus assembly secretin CpaC